MNTREFIGKLAFLYNEPPMIKNEPNIRLVVLEEWLNRNNFTNEKLDSLFQKTISSFTCTSVNNYPLPSHIQQIIEKENLELAKNTTDKIFWAILNIGYKQEGCRDRAYTHIGPLGVDVITSTYGKWHIICEVADKSNIENMKAHVRDSIITYINLNSNKQIEKK